MARNNQRGGRNNNPEGRNQYSNGWMGSARERPMTTAAVAAATVGAGVFLWSRRNQISEQISNLSDQISDWSQNLRSDSEEYELELADSGTGASSNMGTQSRSPSSKSRSSGRGMNETGGGNASLGRQTGGSGISSGPGSNARS